MRLGKPVRKSCSAEWAICSAIARAALTSRKTMTAPVALPFTVVDGGDGVFDRNFKSVAPDQDAVRRQVHGSVLPNRHFHGIGGGLAARGVQDSEHFGHGPACRFLHDQPVIFSATRLRKVMFPRDVGANDGVADAVERDLGAFLFHEQRFFHGLALDRIAQRPQQPARLDLAFDQIILRAFL